MKIKPNHLTWTRIWLTIPLIIIINSFFDTHPILTALAFILVAWSDSLDGYWARKSGMVTKKGKILDPLADKVMVISVLFSLSFLNLFPLWGTYLIAFREISIMTLRIFALQKNIVIPANKAGKFKTAITCTTIAWILFSWPFASPLIYLTIIITLYSGLNYLVDYSNVMEERKIHAS